MLLAESTRLLSLVTPSSPHKKIAGERQHTTTTSFSERSRNAAAEWSVSKVNSESQDQMILTSSQT